MPAIKLWRGQSVARTASTARGFKAGYGTLEDLRRAFRSLLDRPAKSKQGGFEEFGFAPTVLDVETDEGMARDKDEERCNAQPL